WYSPDDRDKSEQLLFEKVEVKPQALEHLFSRACGIAFRVSVDNFSLLDHDIKPFRDAVLTQSEKFMRDGMPARAALFLQGLNALDVNINTNLDPSDLHQCDALQLGSRNNVDGVSDCIDCE
ncbi:MAG: elongation factor P hydroxylase, partial [Pseudomonadota bacterium]